MKISAVQTYVAGLIEAHPTFAAARVKAILDDGTYPKIPALEKELREKGLAIIIWRTQSAGLIDTAKTGVSNQLLHIAVVIQENETVNRTPQGTRILPEDALQCVIEGIAGKPKGSPPETPLELHHDAFDNLGKVNGILNIVVNFTKQHRITPI